MEYFTYMNLCMPMPSLTKYFHYIQQGTTRKLNPFHSCWVQTCLVFMLGFVIHVFCLARIHLLKLSLKPIIDMSALRYTLHCILLVAYLYTCTVLQHNYRDVQYYSILIDMYSTPVVCMLHSNCLLKLQKVENISFWCCCKVPKSNQLCKWNVF